MIFIFTFHAVVLIGFSALVNINDLNLLGGWRIRSEWRLRLSVFFVAYIVSLPIVGFAASRLYRFDVDFGSLGGNDYQKVRRAANSVYQVVDYINENFSEDDTVLTFRMSDFAYYLKVPFVSHMDRRMVSVYDSADIAEARRRLARLGITHVFLPLYGVAEYYNGPVAKLLESSELVFSSGDSRLYRLVDTAKASSVVGHETQLTDWSAVKLKRGRRVPPVYKLDSLDVAELSSVTSYRANATGFLYFTGGGFPEFSPLNTSSSAYELKPESLYRLNISATATGIVNVYIYQFMNSELIDKSMVWSGIWKGKSNISTLFGSLPRIGRIDNQQYRVLIENVGKSTSFDLHSSSLTQLGRPVDSGEGRRLRAKAFGWSAGRVGYEPEPNKLVRQRGETRQRGGWGVRGDGLFLKLHGMRHRALNTGITPLKPSVKDLESGGNVDLKLKLSGQGLGRLVTHWYFYDQQQSCVYEEELKLRNSFDFFLDGDDSEVRHVIPMQAVPCAVMLSLELERTHMHNQGERGKQFVVLKSWQADFNGKKLRAQDFTSVH